MLNLIEPTLLLDVKKCKENIQRMVDKAKKYHVSLRPHFKTHQSHEIGRWFRNAGVDRITVSSLKMAEYFAEDGWNDITVAFPLNIHEIDRINRIAEKAKLNLLLVSPETIDRLAEGLKHTVNVLIEVDNGYHRTGVDPNDSDTIDQILTKIEQHSQIHFIGFLSHAGHSYKVNSDPEKIKRIHQESVAAIVPLKEKYKDRYPHLILSAGDTPTYSVSKNFEGIDEVRPGNMVFYDLAQYKIGSCNLDQIAVAMACPVVALYPDRNEIVIYGGGVHFSKDSSILENGTPYFGKIVTPTDKGWNTNETDMYLKSLSQEHGIIHAPSEAFKKISIGDFMYILPIHSCLTSDVMKEYVTLEGGTIGRL